MEPPPPVKMRQLGLPPPDMILNVSSASTEEDGHEDYCTGDDRRFPRSPPELNRNNSFTCITQMFGALPASATSDHAASAAAPLSPNSAAPTVLPTLRKSISMIATSSSSSSPVIKANSSFSSDSYRSPHRRPTVPRGPGSDGSIRGFRFSSINLLAHSSDIHQAKKRQPPPEALLPHCSLDERHQDVTMGVLGERRINVSWNHHQEKRKRGDCTGSSPEDMTMMTTNDETPSRLIKFPRHETGNYRGATTMPAPPESSGLESRMTQLGVSSIIPLIGMPPPPPPQPPQPPAAVAAPLSLIIPNMPVYTPTREELSRSQVEHLNQEPLHRIVKACCDRGIKIVILDLDYTLLSIHTGGQWAHSAAELCLEIRPQFRVLIPLILRAQLLLGIATFSPQEDLVKKILTLAFPSDVKLEENVFVRGHRANPALRRRDSYFSYNQEEEDEEEEQEIVQNDGTENPSIIIDAQSSLLPSSVSAETSFSIGDYGKRDHIECIIRRSGLPDVDPGEILFIDDDLSNVKAAAKAGHRVVKFNPRDCDALASACLTSLNN